MIEHRSNCAADENLAKCDCGASLRRFLNDTTFHAFTHQLTRVLEEMRYELSDLQQACFLADELYQKRKIR